MPELPAALSKLLKDEFASARQKTHPSSSGSGCRALARRARAETRPATHESAADGARAPWPWLCQIA
jgi:hypothetical protein